MGGSLPFSVCRLRFSDLTARVAVSLGHFKNSHNRFEEVTLSPQRGDGAKPGVAPAKRELPWEFSHKSTTALKGAEECRPFRRSSPFGYGIL